VKVKKEPKAKAAKPEPVAVAPVVDTPAATLAEEVDGAELAAQATEFLAKLNQLGSLFASLKTEFRTLEKKWSRELKTAQKSQAKRKRKSGNRQPSGFVKPTKISDELAKFLEKPTGTEMARTDVTREINKYIRSHNLQDAGNGRKINPDAKLQTLLKLKKTDELTYFNLQRYMSPHFHKAEKVVAAGSV
jgi:upstream activation factor subunit UAF30